MSSVDKAKYKEAMAWWFQIYYMSIASLCCILPILADLLNGLLCTRNYRFPCNYFSFYIAFLTAMSVASRLLMTFDSPLPNDQLAKLGSMATMAFMSTMVANMLPSLGSMDINILDPKVIHFCIIISTKVILDTLNTGHFFIGMQVVLLVFLLIILISSTITVPSIKKILEFKYYSIRQILSNHQHPQDTAVLQKLRQDVERYEIMLETGNPEFAIVSGMISMTVCILMGVEILRTFGLEFRWCSILTTESIGVVVGSIAPICRSFMEASFLASARWNSGVFKVEEYWTWKLYEWKYSRANFRSRKRVRKLRNRIFSLFIGFQIGILVTCKIIGLIPIVVLICIRYFSYYLKSVREMWFAPPPSRE